MLSCRLQKTHWVARLAEIADRDEAERWRHGAVAVLRDELPVMPSGEFYWHDLIGIRVVNRQGDYLGDIIGVMDIGVHDVIRVKPSASEAELLIPFVAPYIDSDVLENNELRVDWRAEW